MRGRLEHADLEVVEGGVIVDIARTDDQTVIGNDLDAGVGGLLQRVRQRRAVDRRDHQDLLLLGDHVLDLGELVRNVVVGVLQVGLVALGLQNLDHVVAVGDPARRGLGRHRDADGAFVLRLRGADERESAQCDRGRESLNTHAVPPREVSTLPPRLTPHRWRARRSATRIGIAPSACPFV